MNKVIEYASDLVNLRVAHNLMRLIAEGFGEDDDDADSQPRSSSIDAYLRRTEASVCIFAMQVMCWVLGEYGIAYEKHLTPQIIGKLCGVV